jgi:threonylcarbamoyladenosine tRNA methylthiotransferase MtaB
MKVYIRTFGCRANQYDTEAVRAMLAQSGAEEVASPADADLAIFNSCTVTSEAEADLRAGVRSAARSNPAIRSVVMGCAAGVPGRDEALSPLATLPGVESLIPGADLDAIATLIGAKVRARATAQTGARALLRIQDGCDEHCTFCATTRARGSNRSRSIDSIVAEAAALASVHPEIVITGIHIGTYGRDIGSSLGELVSELIAAIPDVRFRLSSVEATEVDERLAALFDDPRRLAPHLHAPLQSGSDRVLRRMGRHWYDARSYAASISRIVDGRGVFGLSADVITGFPGETEDDHRLTLALVEAMPFTSLHVFPYSPRPGTAATRMGGQVPGGVARSRAAQLRAVAMEKGSRYAESRSGGSCDVVVTARGKGLTGDYLSVAVSDTALPRRSRFTGTLSGTGELTATPA